MRDSSVSTSSVVSGSPRSENRGSDPMPARGGHSLLCRSDVAVATNAGLAGHKQRGQGLIIAILVMFVLLIIGALFVTALSQNLGQTGRTREAARALELAQAGIQFASDCLTNSPLGADWRPPVPPSPGSPEHQLYYDDFERARGWDRPDPNTAVQFTKYPDPLRPNPANLPNIPMGKGRFLLKVEYAPGALKDDPLGRCLKITAVGRSPERPSVYAMVTAYKPIMITDYLRLITNPDKSSTQDQLGVPPDFDWDADGSYNYVLSGSDPPLVLDREPAFASEFYGPLRSQSDLFVFGLDRFFLHSFIEGRRHRRDKVEVAGAFVFDPNYATALTMYLYDYTLDPPGYNLDDPRAGLDSGDMGWTSRYVGQVLTASSTGEVFYRDDRWSVDSAVDPSRQVERAGAPDAFTPAPLTTRARYLELTRNSGYFRTLLRGTDPFTFNTGWFGYGEGIYIDNSSDIQYGHDIDRLTQELGLPDTVERLGQGWWDGSVKMYSPPGVRIIFLDKDVALSAQDRAAIPDDPTKPDIIITRYDTGSGGDTQPGWDGKWRDIRDGTNTTSGVGDYVELDYPPTGVIYCEGNARVEGRLPRLPNYGVTLVSGGTIYIEGGLTRPSDRGESGAYAEDNTHLALVARDVVALNSGPSAPPIPPEIARLKDEPTYLTDASRESDARDGSPPYHWLVMPAQYFWYGATIPEWDPDEPPTVDIIHSGDASLEPGERTELRMFVNGKEYDFDPGTDGTQRYLFFVHPPATAPNESNAVGKNYETRSFPLEGYVPAGPTRVSIELRLGEGSDKPYWLKEVRLPSPPTIVSALVYAQRGPWFVVPGNLFDPAATGIPNAEEFRRYNQQIVFYGAIAEAHSAPASMVRRWSDYRGFPYTHYTKNVGGTDYELPLWHSIRYVYDGSLASPRGFNLPRLPALPASPALIYRR